MARLLKRHTDAIVKLQRDGVTRARIREALSGGRELPGLRGISADDPVRISNAELASLRRQALAFEIGGRPMTRDQAVALTSVVGRRDLTRAEQVRIVAESGLRVSERFVRELGARRSFDLRRRPLERRVPRDFTGARYLYEGIGRLPDGSLVPVRFSQDVELRAQEVREMLVEGFRPFLDGDSSPPEALQRIDLGGAWPLPGRVELLSVSENVGGPWAQYDP